MLNYLKRKVDRTHELIREMLGVLTNPYVSCSWGKDSIVLLWLMREHRQDIPVLWFDWGEYDEYPDTYTFKDEVVKAWNVNLTIIKPETPIGDQWRLFGIPRERFSKEEMKYNHEFATAFIRESNAKGYDGHFLGMRMQESIRRRIVLRTRGPMYFHQHDKIWRTCPLWNWKTEDVWGVIDAERLPVHPIYSKTLFQVRDKIRLGCMAESCFHWNGSIVFLKHYYPDRYNRLAAEFPELRGMV